MSTATDDLLQLQQPVTDGGIRAVNFFNGRLLSGADLSREQAARREADARLGLALGHGVASGLNVVHDRSASKPGQPVVSIGRGLALNRNGQPLRLMRDTRVALARSYDAPADGRLFGDCKPLGGGSDVAGAGLYVLTIAPAAWSEGRAASSGLDPANVRCNTDATVEGLQFRLLPIERRHYADLDVAAPTFRNEIAYRCFGPGVQAGWFADLLGASDRSQNLLTGLRGLSDDDVPLALLFFTGVAELQFVDVWAVRRDVARDDGDGPFAALGGDGRLAVGRAMFMQFQSHVESLAGRADGDLTAMSGFRMLPPLGLIQVDKEQTATDAVATRFFSGMAYRSPAFLSGARLELLVRESLCGPPIDTQGNEAVWLYRLIESRRYVDNPSTTAPARSWLAFSSGQLPYGADAQYDIARWDYGNFALAR